MNVYKLLIVAVIVLLVGCDNLDKKKVARKNFDPSKDLSLSDHLSAADSMAVFSCLMKDTSQLIETAFNVIAEPVFESRLKRDFDELTDALTIKDEKDRHLEITVDLAVFPVDPAVAGDPRLHDRTEPGPCGKDRNDRIRRRMFFHRHIARGIQGQEEQRIFPDGVKLRVGNKADIVQEDDIVGIFVRSTVDRVLLVCFSMLKIIDHEPA